MNIRLACGEGLPKLKALSGESLPYEGDTRQPGLFRMGRRLLAVNPPQNEGIPQDLPAEEIQRELQYDGQMAAEREKVPQGGRSWIVEFAAVLLGLLLGEAFLVSAGRRRNPL